MTKWTIDTLKEHFQALREDDKEALKTALVAAEKRLDLLNELREGVATVDQLEALEKIVDELKGRLDTYLGAVQGVQLSKANLYAALGVAVAALGVIVLIANHVIH